MEDSTLAGWNRRLISQTLNMYPHPPQVEPEPQPEPPKHDNHVWVFHTLIAVVALGCLVYWGNGNHLAVEVPVYDASMMQRYQVELELTRKQRDDYKKQAELTKKMLLASNTKITQYEQHLKALAESVPPQPVILEAVRKEAVTEKGLRQVVARNFGSEIAKRIQVRE